MNRVMLYFGSFNPVHNGHIALAEYVLEQGLCDEAVLVVSPHSPYKSAAELVPALDRFEMAEIACTASKYPDRIKPSSVELLLPTPSYTIDTLRFLEEQCGGKMRFSLLMGADQIAALDGWKQYERILEYPIFVYPRRGERVERFRDRITLLEDAPLLDFSATDVRERAGRGEDLSALVAPGVETYIREKKFWNPATKIEALTRQIAEQSENASLYVARGKIRYHLNRWGEALNDFNRALRIDPDLTEARQYADMVQEILAFRYKDIYNP